MVAGSDDDVHVGHLFLELYELLVEQFFRGRRRLLDVEHIAAHKQDIGLFFLAPSRQLVEEMEVLVAAIVVLVEDLTYVQVGSVQYFHWLWFWDDKDNGFFGQIRMAVISNIVADILFFNL